MATTATAQMYIDILKYRADVFASERLQEIQCFRDYREDPEKSIDVNALITYVVLLYSKDSILNRKPMPQLAERRHKAALMAELDPTSDPVINLIFDLGSEKIRDLILGYLIHINQLLWAERCIVESQMQENQRIRFRPIQNKKVTTAKKTRKKKDDEEDFDDGDQEELDDNAILAASQKKFTLTEHVVKYMDLIKKYDAEIFTDHENVKESIGRTARKSLESIAQ